MRSTLCGVFGGYEEPPNSKAAEGENQKTQNLRTVDIIPASSTIVSGRCGAVTHRQQNMSASAYKDA